MADETINARSRSADTQKAQDFMNLEDTGRDLTAALKNSSADVTKAASKTSKAMDALNDTFTGAIKQFARYLDKSWNQIKNAYESSNRDIATRMQYSQSQMRGLWDDYSDQINKSNMKNFTNTREMIDELQNVLRTGLRGRLATEKATNDLLAKRLVPTLNTASRRLTDLSVVFNSSNFMQGIAGFQHYLDNNGNFSASEEILNTALDTYSTTMMRWASELEGDTQENFERLIKIPMAAIDAFGEKYGPDSAEALTNFMSESMNGLSNNLINYLSGYGTADDMRRAMTDPAEMSKMLNSLVGVAGEQLRKSAGNSEITLQVLREQFGIPRELADTLITAYNDMQKTGVQDVSTLIDIQKIIEGYDGKTAQDLLEKKDFYTTITEQAENIKENMLTKATITTTKIPYFDEFFHEVTSTLGKISNAIVFGGATSILGKEALSLGGAEAAATTEEIAAITATHTLGGALGTAGLGIVLGSLIGEGMARGGQAIGLYNDYEDEGFTLINAYNTMKAGPDHDIESTISYNKAISSKIFEASRKWEQYFEDPSFVKNYLPLIGDADNNGLPDNEAVAYGFKNWRSRTGKGSNYTISDYMRDNNLIAGSHALGLDYVPYDNYIAALHEGESVLNSSSAKALRALQELGIPSHNANDDISIRVIERVTMVTRAIENQTEVIVSRLDYIIESIKSSGPVASGTTAAFG